ncbi:hypothetical protein [Cupriavidus sp. DF5525]|uniref:hypothetical protein n=1 Tax=Cupriavidus sp. DF5525 TaxID=3160989 RepID=UPI0003B00F60|nr:hypothetical protein N234_29090 [Ralstonia pickettii DTP0602]
MNLEDIERLVQRLDGKPIARLELELEGKHLVLQRPADGDGVGSDGASQGMPQAETPGAALDCIRAPAAGVFYASHPLAEETFALADRTVEAGEAVGYLRVGSVLSAVNAGERGVPGEQLAESGTLVGFGQALFAFEKAS